MMLGERWCENVGVEDNRRSSDAEWREALIGGGAKVYVVELSPMSGAGLARAPVPLLQMASTGPSIETDHHHRCCTSSSSRRHWCHRSSIRRNSAPQLVVTALLQGLCGSARRGMATAELVGVEEKMHCDL